MQSHATLRVLVPRGPSYVLVPYVYVLALLVAHRLRRGLWSGLGVHHLLHRQGLYQGPICIAVLCFESSRARPVHGPAVGVPQRQGQGCRPCEGQGCRPGKLNRRRMVGTMQGGAARACGETVHPKEHIQSAVCLEAQPSRCPTDALCSHCVPECLHSHPSFTREPSLCLFCSTPLLKGRWVVAGASHGSPFRCEDAAQSIEERANV